MKKFSKAFSAHLAAGVTTLCWCWKLTRCDGAVLGFTDHDADIVCNGVTYLAATGLSAGEAQTEAGYAVTGMAIAGAFSSDALSVADLIAGVYDGAMVEIYRVNWADPTVYGLVRKGWLGEVRQGRTAFSAEIRGLMQALNQNIGRSFCYLCDATVGDTRCGIDLTSATNSGAAYQGSGTITAVTDNRRFSVSGLADFSTGWFGGGKLVWTSGVCKGLSGEVKRHGTGAATVTVELWQAASASVAVGDAFTVTAGCDKKFSTCKTKFANAANHRGFPYMIGNDAVVAYAYGATGLDGGSRYGN